MSLKCTSISHPGWRESAPPPPWLPIWVWIIPAVPPSTYIICAVQKVLPIINLDFSSYFGRFGVIFKDY